MQREQQAATLQEAVLLSKCRPLQSTAPTLLPSGGLPQAEEGNGLMADGHAMIASQIEAKAGAGGATAPDTHESPIGASPAKAVLGSLSSAARAVLTAAPPAAQTWGVSGLSDSRVRRALEAQPGAAMAAGYKYVEQYGSWDTEAVRLGCERACALNHAGLVRSASDVNCKREWQAEPTHDKVD